MWEIGLFVVLLVAGYGVGSFNERRHYASIRRREEEMRHLLLFATRDGPPATEGWLVAGSTVVSVDYFKRFLAGLRAILGGQVDAYTSLVERGRREAILRMKAEALAGGATHVINVKLQTARVFHGDRRSTGSVEVLAYGTAVRAVPQAA